MESRWSKWLERFIIGFFACLLIALFMPTRQSQPQDESPRRTQCQTQLQQIALAFQQYSKDYDDKFPPAKLADAPAKNAPHGWADALRPYIKEAETFQCPAEPHVAVQEDPTKSGYTDYFYNANVAGKKETFLDHSFATILAGDGNARDEETHARYTQEALPENWRKGKTSPAQRHLKGANYAFIDGHIKWLQVGDISDKSMQPGERSFAARELDKKRQSVITQQP